MLLSTDVLSDRIYVALLPLCEHMSGRHDQKTHGRRGGSKYLRVWEGPVYGATDDQEEFIRGAMGFVPENLLSKDLSVNVMPSSHFSGSDIYGYYTDKKIFLNSGAYSKQDTSQSRNLNIELIVHEAAHDVWANRIQRTSRKNEISFLVKEWEKELSWGKRVGSALSWDYSQEMFAHAFAVRAYTGSYMDERSNAFFQELGI